MKNILKNREKYYNLIDNFFALNFNINFSFIKKKNGLRLACDEMKFDRSC